MKNVGVSSGRIHIVPLEDLGSRLPDMILWTCAGASGNKTAVVSSESVCVAFNIGKTSQPVYLGDAGKFAGVCRMGRLLAAGALQKRPTVRDEIGGECTAKS